MNLVDFHEESRGRVAVPIALGLFRTVIPLDDRGVPQQGAAVSPKEVPQTVMKAYHIWSGKGRRIDPNAWNNSRYFPVPTIVEAASAVYLNHDVKDLAYSRSGIDNLEATQKAVADAVRDARVRKIKKLIVITDVPGAGKTLAGLNAVQLLQQDLDIEHEQASFLSGNGPLVEVLQEALKAQRRQEKKGVARSIQSRIREMHRFVRDSYGDTRAPADRLIVFDEAQRAWTAKKNKKKFDRDVSEPEMVLEIMGCHEGWAVVVALVGGGQEIHGGEAGLAAWGMRLREITHGKLSRRQRGFTVGLQVAGSRLFRATSPDTTQIVVEQSFHLSISKRSFETEITAEWVNAVLNGQQSEALSLASNRLPIHLTRELNTARRWLRDNAKGERRAGLVASSVGIATPCRGGGNSDLQFSGGHRLPKMVLEPEGDFRSSNQLEVALSEFELQGLEIDLAGLLWGGDLVFRDGRPVTRKLKGCKWADVQGTGDPQASADDPRIRILNKYRVLLTRFRKGMVIFVPKGCLDDQTRAPKDFDAVYDYLLGCGITPLPDSTQ